MSNFNAAARDFREKSTEALHTAKDKVVDISTKTAQKVDRQAHKHPWYFVGAGALIATVLGFFVGRKSQR